MRHCWRMWKKAVLVDFEKASRSLADGVYGVRSPVNGSNQASGYRAGDFATVVCSIIAGSSPQLGDGTMMSVLLSKVPLSS